MATTALFTPDGKHFRIEQLKFALNPGLQQLFIKIGLLPDGQGRPFDFNLTLLCYPPSIECTSEAHVAVVQSGKGCKFALFVLVRCVARIPPPTMCILHVYCLAIKGANMTMAISWNRTKC